MDTSADAKKQDRRVFDADDRLCSDKLSKIIVGKELGRGSFKIVYQKCSDDACFSAPEVLQVVTPETQKELMEIRKEAMLLSKISEETKKKGLQPIVLPITSYQECTKTNKAFIIQPRISTTMEKLGQQQAAQFTASYPGFKSFKELILVFTAAQLRSAFYLAQELYKRHGIVHGDLKPDNVFVDDKQNFFLGDLGFTGAFRGPFSKVSEPTPGFTRNWDCGETIPVNPQLRAYYNTWQLEMILRASYITLVAVTPSPRTDLQKFVLFDSVEQLGSSVAAIPPQARVNLNEVCGKLQEKIKDHEDNIEILREKLAPMIIKRIDPASIQVKSRDDMVSTILAASQTQDFADLLTKIPPWMRYLVQQGLDAVLVEPMSTLYMPLPSSSTGAKVAGRRMGKKKTMKKAK